MTVLSPHDTWPQPGCPRCEVMAHDAGHASVNDYLGTLPADNDGCSE